MLSIYVGDDRTNEYENFLVVFSNRQNMMHFVAVFNR